MKEREFPLASTNTNRLLGVNFLKMFIVGRLGYVNKSDILDIIKTTTANAVYGVRYSLVLACVGGREIGHDYVLYLTIY